MNKSSKRNLKIALVALMCVAVSAAGEVKAPTIQRIVVDAYTFFSTETNSPVSIGKSSERFNAFNRKSMIGGMDSARLKSLKKFADGEYVDTSDPSTLELYKGMMDIAGALTESGIPADLDTPGPRSVAASICKLIPADSDNLELVKLLLVHTGSIALNTKGALNARKAISEWLQKLEVKVEVDGSESKYQPFAEKDTASFAAGLVAGWGQNIDRKMDGFPSAYGALQQWVTEICEDTTYKDLRQTLVDQVRGQLTEGMQSLDVLECAADAVKAVAAAAEALEQAETNAAQAREEAENAGDQADQALNNALALGDAKVLPNAAQAREEAENAADQALEAAKAAKAAKAIADQNAKASQTMAKFSSLSLPAETDQSKIVNAVIDQQFAQMIWRLLVLDIEGKKYSAPDPATAANAAVNAVADSSEKAGWGMKEWGGLGALVLAFAGLGAYMAGILPGVERQ